MYVVRDGGAIHLTSVFSSISAKYLICRSAFLTAVRKCFSGVLLYFHLYNIFPLYFPRVTTFKCTPFKRAFCIFFSSLNTHFRIFFSLFLLVFRFYKFKFTMSFVSLINISLAIHFKKYICCIFSIC